MFYQCTSVYYCVLLGITRVLQGTTGFYWCTTGVLLLYLCSTMGLLLRTTGFCWGY